ncbi:molybdenum cofactor biosynthesis protein MoaE [Pokkaliibacter sp. CJK22405]|uniref:molybdenum cofactor biosynthesis protein MoaE n=1 Tax=Pokkaliibacter sp. CJK22405 TaxID=3384615 RepID=UPI003984EE66
MSVWVGESTIDQQALLASWYESDAGDTGAIVTFSGLVRDFSERSGVQALVLEHYPGMTEKVLHDLEEEACSRWALQRVVIAHRVGRMTAGEVIVLVAVASAHRKDAFAACEWLMDILKTRAPFWKKEETAEGSHWVEQRQSDIEREERWSAKTNA